MSEMAKQRVVVGRPHTEETKAKLRAKKHVSRGPVSDTEKAALSARMSDPSFPRGKGDTAATQKTMQERYGSHYTQTDAFKLKVSGDNHPKRQADKLLTCSAGAVVDLARAAGKEPSNAVRVFRRYGEVALLRYLSEEKHISSLEVLGEELFGLPHYNKKLPGLPYRPDFLIGEVAVNLDGLYVHSEKEKRYHFDMREKYEAVGRRVLQFREDEILYQGAIVRSIVDGLAGRHASIGARKCELRRLTPSEMKDFFDANHLMGNHAAAVGFGLFADGLVCAMSVRRIEGGFEIARFGSLLGLRVAGGFSKLLAHVEKIYPGRVVSFCDLRYGNGGVYRKAGFVLEGVTLGFSWTDYKHTFNRLRCRNEEQAKAWGWVPIYDAGQAKFVKENSATADKRDETTRERT